jgi:hypothetical protein
MGGGGSSGQHLRIPLRIPTRRSTSRAAAGFAVRYKFHQEVGRRGYSLLKAGLKMFLIQGLAGLPGDFIEVANDGLSCFVISMGDTHNAAALL